MKRQQGFTIVELTVTMALGSLLVVATIGMYLAVLGQSPVIKERNTLSTNLQNALNRINDDVRRSSSVGLYNLTADPNAPTTITADYANVPGPDPDTDNDHFWRMSESRLLLNQTPVTTAGNPIYDNVEYAAGEKNTIVYYVRGDALYRRVIAADVTGNSVETRTCTGVSEGGCANSDIKLIDNLKTEPDDPSDTDFAPFKITYLDRNGNPIPNIIVTGEDGDGNEITEPDFSGFPLTRAIAVTIELKSGQVAGQTVSVSNSMRMQFRSQPNLVPEDVVEPYIPPTNGLGEPGLMVGPGGLQLYNATVQGGDVYVKGKVNAGFSSVIGGSGFLAYFGIGKAINLNVANIACGSGASYPAPCAPADQPIAIANNMFASIKGRVCAKDQVDATNIQAFGGHPGLIPGCVPPDTDLPTFNKADFVNSMEPVSLPSSAASCFGNSASTLANRTYIGNMSWDFFCKVSISGSAYITGNLTASNTTIRVAESAGKVRPIIVVNGKINLGSFSRVQPNSYGTTPYFISFFSSDSACSNSNSCTSISPAQLEATLTNYTASNAPIVLANATMTGTSFYSYYGEVYLDFFTKVGAVGGQRVRMNNATVTLDAKL